MCSRGGLFRWALRNLDRFRVDVIKPPNPFSYGKKQKRQSKQEPEEVKTKLKKFVAEIYGAAEGWASAATEGDGDGWRAMRRLRTAQPVRKNPRRYWWFKISNKQFVNVIFIFSKLIWQLIVKKTHLGWAGLGGRRSRTRTRRCWRTSACAAAPPAEQ